jgi:Major Facilitator Superfamily
MTVGSLLILAAPATQIAVLAGRALEGAGFAVLAIAGPVLANANASPRHLPIVVGLTASWIPAGQLAATALAPAAFAWAGWQLLWLVAIAASLALAVWTWVLNRRGTLRLSISSGPASAPPRADPRQRRCLVLAAAVFTLWSGQYFAYMTWLPQYLVEVHGLPPTLAVAGYVIPVIVLILTNLAVGLVLRAGVPLGPLLFVGLVSQAAVWWSIPLTGGGAAGVISLVIYGIGAGICPTCLFAMPSVIVGPGGAAVRAFGVIMTGRNLGVLVGPVLLAQAFELSGGWDISAPIFGTVTVLAAVLGLWLALWLGGSGYGAKR